ncbi:hypothetical protein [Haloactinomyces albus]|uniref:Uncharacterized protein n=1 Tax=Haloactinomyces albus TaxID=1352928 RepID=A0AAE4CPK3_9ACTN|nr:hypothetical protein [Haloactinomyces albus]MDR7301783.1 hypothetical protein [Haloactinomyces albus]
MGPVVVSPAVVLLEDPAGVWSVMALVAAIALGASVLPLRGGHGQHAHAGVGALDVWQLCDSAIVPTRERVPGGWSISREIDQPDPEPEQPRDSGEPRGPSLLERGLAELWEPAPEQEYVGRHRLAEPFDVDVFLTPLRLEFGAARPRGYPCAVAA